METKKQKPLLQRLFRFAGGHKGLTVLGMVLSGVSAIVALLPVVFVWWGIGDILEIYPHVTLTEGIQKNAWLAVACAVGAMLIYVIALMLTHVAAFRIATNMKKEALRHIVNLPLGYFSNTGSGKMRRIISDSASATEAYLAHQLPDLVGAFVTPLAVVIMLFVFHWQLGLLSLISVVLSFVCMSFMFDKEQPVQMKQYQTALEDMNNDATEYVRGIPVVKTFNQSVFSFERFHSVILKYKEYVSQYAVRCRMPMVLFQTGLASTAVFLVLGAIALVGTQGNLEEFFLDFLFYLLFTPICSMLLTKIMWTSQATMMAGDAITRIEDLLAQSPLSQPEHPKVPQGFDITLENVVFTYPGGAKKAVDGVSLRIQQGQTVALVGPSGGGKSTLASLIPRFWDVEEGAVKIGGVDVREIGEAELMQHVSFVFQSTNLYKASILDNLREGKQNASMDEINAAIKAARCEDIIAKLPNGLDSVYGTKGIYLSGGEVQRIALARAILRNAPIILLDEATAFADPENEHQIQQAFRELTKGKTVLMIAHRLSTIRNADQICVISGGKMVEQGTHDQLVEHGGMYCEMWQEYNEAFVWAESEVQAP